MFYAFIIVNSTIDSFGCIVVSQNVVAAKTTEEILLF
jgi:hypothetical protein